MASLAPVDPITQTRVGLLLATAIFAAWLTVHVTSVFELSLQGSQWLLAVPIVALQTWLSVGLFIVSHDAMHGSLAPGHSGINRTVGRLALLLYAGFWLDNFAPRHFDHHRHVGTEDDPDYHAEAPTRAGPWFVRFMREYFGLRELLVLTAIVAVYMLVLRAPIANLLMFWALPAILSSVQLFVFGTFLPHRHAEAPFADQHRARSNEYPWLVSLLTCFHFGYHREHHLSPGTPWWRLPAERNARRAQ